MAADFQGWPWELNMTFMYYSKMIIILITNDYFYDFGIQLIFHIIIIPI